MEENYEIEGEIPDGRLSFSKIKTFGTCPHKFWLQYVEKARGLVRIPMLLGKSFHAGQEHGLKEMIEKRTPSTKEIEEVAVENLKIDFKKEHGLDYTEFDNSKVVAKDDLKRMAGNSFDIISKTFKPISSEKQFDFKLDDNTDVRGRIDAIEDNEKGRGITEFKTTTRKPPVLTTFDSQTTIYQYAEQGIKWIKKFFVIRHLTKNRDISIYIDWKKKDPQSLVDDILDSMKKVKDMIKGCSLNGYPKTNDLTICSWCQYRKGCRPEIFGKEDKIESIINRSLVFTTSERLKGEVKNGY
mgnify:CR=1 FL=1